MVYLFLAPGFEESEAVVPADLLRQAEVETALVSLSGGTVTGAHNITVQADLTVDEVDLDQAEMLVFPGGGTGVENLWNDDRVSALIQEAAGGTSGWRLCVPGPSCWAGGDCWTAIRRCPTPPGRTSWAGPRSCPRPGRCWTESSSPATPAAPPLILA